jgi:hypothetical protein
VPKCTHPDGSKQTKMHRRNGQYQFRTKCGDCGKWRDSYWHLGDRGKTPA